MPEYFSKDEVKNLSSDLVVILDVARKLSGVTFDLFHKDNTEKKERRDVYLKCSDAHARFHMVRSLINAGINRIGIGPESLYVEYEEKPINRIWFL